MKINNKFETVKRKLADRLTKASERYSTTTKKWILAIVGLACAAICITMTALPFLKTKTTANVKTTIPLVVQPSMDNPLLSAQEYHLLNGFIKTMDSLKAVDQDTYQKAMTGREGLIDSILFLLNHSGQQMLKK